MAASRTALELDAVVFDCDGTLSAIEGITELARMNGHAEEVHALTERAMSGAGLNPALYSQRLNLIRPTQRQCMMLGEMYYARRTKNIEILVAKLQEMGKDIFVVSAGCRPAVCHFTHRLNIPEKNVYAVDLYFNEQGDYCDFDHESSLIHNNGKEGIVQSLTKKDRLIYVGDGANDLAVKPYVKKFIGFGVHFPRDKIKAVSDFYVTKNDALALMDIFQC